MEIQSALTSISTAIGIAKTVSDINKEVDASNYKLQMADLRSTLADAKISLSEIREEILAKDQEIKRLKSFDIDAKKLAQHLNHYYKKNKGGDAIGMPYCPHCLEAKNGLFTLHYGKGGELYCGSCKNLYSEAQEMLT